MTNKNNIEYLNGYTDGRRDFAEELINHLSAKLEKHHSIVDIKTMIKTIETLKKEINKN